MKKRFLFFLPFLLSACLFPTDQLSNSTPEPSRTADIVPSAQPTAIQTPTLPPTETPFVLPDFTPFPRIDPDALLMDGFFNDWDVFSPAVMDPAGDSGPSGIDFTGIYAAHTDMDLLLRVALGKTVNLQSETALQITIRDADSEITYDFGERRGRIDGRSVSQDEIGVISLPTVTSDVFEISFPLGLISDGDLEIQVTDPGTNGDTAAFSYAWDHPLDPVTAVPLERPEGTTLRVVSWNVLRDNLFDRRLGDHFARVLQALQPDVILIQEVYIYSEKTTLERITDWLGGEWFARQQGDLITVSRYPFIENWRDSNYNLRARIFPALLDVNGVPLLVFNAHLSCCEKDQDRQDEVDSLIGFLREAPIPPGTPFFLAGDLNLVGDVQQLATLLAGDIVDEDKFGEDLTPDWDGTPLADLVPRHAASRFAFTWRDDGSSFAPGRLDFFIFADSVLNVRGFVLDASELPADVRAAYGLQPDDTTGSDHLPIVADIVIPGTP